MKPRFELEDPAAYPGSARATSPEQVEPEAYDAQGHQCDANQEKSPERPCFVVEEQISFVDLLIGDPAHSEVAVELQRDSVAKLARNRTTLKVAEALRSGAETSWRQEVTERLSNYQARRRPRGPRYPSLQLKFETQEVAWPDAAEVSPKLQSIELSQLAPDPPTPEIKLQTRVSAPIVEPTARIIAFPRSSTTPPSPTEELAEPVFDRPRIMEGPEFPLVPAALGGILIERAEVPANEKRPGFEMPLQSARMARRLAAAVIDGFIVLVGLTSFAGIFWRITTMVPPIRLAAGIVPVIGGMMWAAYQYLLIVYCGTSPGLKLAKLRLSHFDGSTVPRKMRRWRAFASILSGLSLGLGYAWCFLDEDQLCWHDRITRTYMAPRT
jgi:RDD family